MDAALFLLRPLSLPEVVCAAVLSLVALLLVQFLARPQPMVAVRDGEDAPSLPSVS